MASVHAGDALRGHAPARVGIEHVQPEIDGGRFPSKRVAGEDVVVTAVLHADGHDVLAAVVLYRKAGEQSWQEAPMKLLGNDRWEGRFTVPEIGRYEYTLEAWVDHFATWRRDLGKKADAGQDVSIDLLVGADLIDAAAGRASAAIGKKLRSWSKTLRNKDLADQARIEAAFEEEPGLLASRYADRSTSAFYDKILVITVDPEIARFSAWYEMFPRSVSPEPGRHGTFRDCEDRLTYVAEMGFDILYLPPIHPIGRTNRRGKDNSPEAEPDDVGSPWAIGAAEGGHKSIHPQLGTLEDFRRLLARARDLGIEIALDVAFQCSPDHPWVHEHPEWFRHLPDDSIRFAENPPKKYEDIYPLNFEIDAWPQLYQELESVVLFWIEQGVRVFRVDNPHTKPYGFWERMIGDVKGHYPEVIFLSEAFTRPHVMYRLAKLGFTQSYTYFTWRNTSRELREYMTELTATELAEYFRPNLWPNTPDILPEFLQAGGRPAFQIRLILAATLGSSYGIYGPAYELCESQPVAAGREEYLHSEKYQIRRWDLNRHESLKPLITRLNQIRRENPALHSNCSLKFHEVDNEQILVYSKQTDDPSNIVVVAVNLDPYHVHSGYVELDLNGLQIDAGQPYQVHDLLSMLRYTWRGPRNYVQIDPKLMPAQILRIRRHVRTERDFDYYL